MLKMEVDLTDFADLRKDLSILRNSAFRYAAQYTLTDTAKDAKTRMIKQVNKDFIIRNKYTDRSFRVDYAKSSRDVDFMSSEAGSVQPYMNTLEKGGTKTLKGKKGVPIATSYAAGLGENTQPITKLPRKPNRRKNIQLRHSSRKGKTRKQKNIVAVRQAAQSSQKLVFMQLSRGNRQGIFRIIGGKRRPKVKMIWDLSRKSTQIPAYPWLRKSIKGIDKFMGRCYVKNLNKQVRKRLKYLKKKKEGK